MGLILGYIFKINFMMKRRVPRSSRRKGSDKTNGEPRPFRAGEEVSFILVCNNALNRLKSN
jgi:hypothetical protein